MTRQRLALAAVLVMAAAWLFIVSPAAASAATGCGYHPGTVFIDRGAGQGAFEVPLIPSTPGQACTVSVSASAVITLLSGSRPSNVSGNPSSGTVTVTFSPFLVVPRVVWAWRPFCSDPASVVFTATIGGMSTTTSTGANSCQSFGGSSTLERPALLPVPAQPAFPGLASTPTGKGAWAAQAGGTVKSAGDASNLGGPATVAFPVVGMSRTPSGHGYWLVASDGGIFTFGDAVYEGSGAGTSVSAPVTGMSATPTGKGYWLLVQDGTLLNFGDAPVLVLQ